VGLYRAASHFELAGDFVVIAALKEQFNNLLFSLP
jgi:hypothetical protein